MRSLLAGAVGALALVASLSTASVQAEEPAPAPRPKKTVVIPNARCPVTGEPAQEETRVAWGELEIRLCCPACEAPFLADPVRYARVLLVDLTEQLASANARIKDLEAKCAKAKEPEKEKEKAKETPKEKQNEPPKEK